MAIKSPQFQHRSRQVDAESDRPELTWCLDLLQAFDALLGIASSLAAESEKPAASDVQAGSPVMNLYLVVCALDQILSDYLHRGYYDLTRVGLRGPAHRILAAVSEAQRSVRRLSAHVLGLRLQQSEQELLNLAQAIASSLLAGQPTAPEEVAVAIGRLKARAWPVSVRRSRLKIPQSFRGVDLYPEDCALIARRASEQEGDMSTPVLVVGLRTSGLYLAPLCAAALERLGHTSVSLITLRPGVPLLPAEARTVRQVSSSGGWAFIVDDPSWRGEAMAIARATLTDRGFAPSRVCLAAFAIANQPVLRGAGPASRSEQDIDAARAWAGFTEARKVTVEPDEWFVHQLLACPTVERWLNSPSVLERLCADHLQVRDSYPFSPTGLPPIALRAAEAKPRPRRYHVLKVFEVELGRGNERWTETLLARGVGLGFFGYHSWLVASRLDEFIPKLVCLHQGILITRWERGSEDVSPQAPEPLRIAAYVAARSQRLPLAASQANLPERRAVYTAARQVARLLSRTMGRTGAIAQFRAADAIACIRSKTRAVVDGRMGPAEWVRSEDGQLLKVDFEEHGFDITDRCVTDPSYDLAAASIELGLSPNQEQDLLDEYSRLTGDVADLAARMTVHKLQSGWSALQGVGAEGLDLTVPIGRLDYARELAKRETLLTRTVNGYLSHLYLDQVAAPTVGPVWAIDLDDTLEADRLGFETISPAGAQALRMLAAHGHMAVLSTGRSLDELQDRCRLYGLRGGVGEYGSVIWDAHRQEVIPVISSEARQNLDRLREVVLAETDILVDPRYQYTLRLFRSTSDGRRGMPIDQVQTLMQRHGIRGLEVIEGFRKDVVWAAGTDKAVAFDRLKHALPTALRDSPLHVIGDAFTDLALMRMAAGRYAPGNAEREVLDARTAMKIRVARRRQQAGVLEIVRSVLHSRRGSCKHCAPPNLEPADAQLVQVLSIQDRGRWGRLVYALHPASLRAFEL